MMPALCGQSYTPHSIMRALYYTVTIIRALMITTCDYTVPVSAVEMLCSVGLLLVLVNHDMFPCTHSLPDGDVCWQLMQVR